MPAPKWKLFSVLWAVSIALWILPYVVQRFGSLDVKNAFSGYPWNFSPFYAVGLFGGAFLANRGVAMAAPVAVYAVMNVALAIISGRPSWATAPEVWFNYALFAIFPIFGFGLDRCASPLRPALVRSFAASVTWFLLSNLPVYFISYPRTAAGLADCYVSALPFFPATLGSALFFTGLLFSPVGVELARGGVLLPGAHRAGEQRV
jgi:hypothetical protein